MCLRQRTPPNARPYVVHTYPTSDQHARTHFNQTRQHTFARALEKESHDKDLQPSHHNHHNPLNDAKVEYAPLRTPYSAKVAVLARAEVLLIPVDGGELAGDFEDGLFERGVLFGGGALLGGELSGTGLVLDLFNIASGSAI